MKEKVYAIITAAGKGTRMGTKVAKQYLDINGLPVIVHTLKLFSSVEYIDGIVLVVPPEQQDGMKDEILHKYSIDKPILFTAGGAERQHSVYNGIKALQGKAQLVIIHDGVRPLVTRDIIDASVENAKKHGAAVVGMPVKDTIRQIDEDFFAVATLERSSLWLIQTPQTFQYDIIMDAHSKADSDGYIGTDDGVLVERLGKKVKMVRGSYENIKITTPEDIIIAEEIMRRRVNL